MTRIRRSAVVAARPDEVWAVLADVGAIASWVPLIEHSCLLSERAEGAGTVRRVQIGRQVLVERVADWEPPRRLGYHVDGLPPLAGRPRTTWTLEPAGGGRSATEVTVITGIETGRNPLRMVAARAVLRRMAGAAELMLAGLAGAVDRPPATTGRPGEEQP